MPGRFRLFGRSRPKPPGADAALAQFRDKLVREARYWGQVADEEDADPLRRACMAVRSHAFAQAAAHAEDVLISVFDTQSGERHSWAPAPGRGRR